MHRLANACACLLLLLIGGCVQPDRQPASSATEPSSAVPTLLVSIDGFRADYLDRGVTPNLSGLASSGVRARAMRPSFPSLTFPNHYTLVTGRRPDQHGITNNTMEDPLIPGVTFKLSNREAVADNRWWDDAEPIWVTAERQGLRTATLFWPGSEAAIRGVRPSDWLTFDDKLPNEARVDRVLDWLGRPKADRPRFATLYFSEVDHAGHAHGPDDPRTNDAVANVDRAIGRLLEGLRIRGLMDRVNLVIVSDHGMAATSSERVIRLDMVADPDDYRVVSAGSVAGIEPVAGREERLGRALLKPQAHMSCWRKGAIPKRLDYGRHRRVPSFVCLAEPGWLISTGPAQRTVSGGAHGYDNMAPEMAALFVASGPSFRAGVVLPEIDNVDVYPLLARLIGVTPAPGAGRLSKIGPALR